ncbi:MAG: UPF0280 family protein [Candidatus Marinimicrobia bacterium]|nr:UPF0280 family protein [Candidatus Neomarinimicrobiota bacterium]
MIQTLRLQNQETIAMITAEERFIPIAEAEIANRRAEIERFIARFPVFQTTLEPYRVPDDAPEIVREMANLSAACGVGPMAAVAGAIARYAVLAMQNAGCRHAIFDNGGDIALINDRPVMVGIFTGDSPIKNIGFRIPPRDKILGVCTSSGIIGHSLSFGRAHAAVTIADDPVLADAAATALGNRIQVKNAPKIKSAMNEVLSFGISGCLVIIDDYIGFAGEMPEICRVEVDDRLIAK